MNFIKFVRKTDNVLISWYEKIAALSLKQTTCRLHALWSMAVFCTNRWKINLHILIKQFRQQGCINSMFQLSAEETSLHSNTPRSKTAFCFKKSDHVVTWWTSFFQYGCDRMATRKNMFNAKSAIFQLYYDEVFISVLYTVMLPFSII